MSERQVPPKKGPGRWARGLRIARGERVYLLDFYRWHPETVTRKRVQRRRPPPRSQASYQAMTARAKALFRSGNFHWETGASNGIVVERSRPRLRGDQNPAAAIGPTEIGGGRNAPDTPPA